MTIVLIQGMFTIPVIIDKQTSATSEAVQWQYPLQVYVARQWFLNKMLQHTKIKEHLML